jgi:hypothetical protein
MCLEDKRFTETIKTSGKNKIKDKDKDKKDKAKEKMNELSSNSREVVNEMNERSKASKPVGKGTLLRYSVRKNDVIVLNFFMLFLY